MAFLRLGALAASAVLLAACSKHSAPAPAAPVAHTVSTVAVKPLPPTPAPAKVLTADAAQGHLVAQFDQDHDGRVSLREMLQQSVKQQMAADTNHDGVLSSDEFHHGMGDAALKDPYIAELFKSIDKNGDGRLDEQEIASHAWPGIAALDRNRDGFIDAADSSGAAPAQANHAASQKGQ